MTAAPSRRTFARGAAVAVGGQWMKYALQLLSLVILARLLPPEDFGLVAMVTAIANIATVVGDFGLSLAAIQAEHLSARQRSNLFWLNTAIGAICTASVCAATPLIVGYYGDQRLAAITLAISGTFLLNSTAVQFRVELTRSLRFRRIAGIELLAHAAGFVAACVAALAGASYWALVLQQLIISVVMLGGMAAGSGWVPGLPRRRAGIRDLLAFGGTTFLAHVVNYISVNVNAALVGRFAGPVALGLYSRAFQIVALPVQQLGAPLTNVVLPALRRAGPERLEAVVLDLHRALVLFSLAPLALFVAAAEPLLRVVLGQQWGEAGLLLQILTAGAVFQVLAFSYYWLFLSQGRTKVLFWVEFPGRALAVAAAVAVAPWGAEAIAATWAGGMVITWAIGSSVGMRMIGVRSWPLTQVSVSLVAVYLTPALALALLYDRFLEGASDGIALLVLTGAWVLAVGAAFLAVPWLRRQAMLSLRLLRSVGRRGTEAAPSSAGEAEVVVR